MKKIDIHKEKIDHPFEVPENYFSQLSADILDKKSALKKSPVFWSPKVQYAFASAMIILIALSIVFVVNQSTAEAEDLLAEVSNEEIIHYLSDYELTEEDILSSFDSNSELEFDYFEEDPLEDLNIDESVLDEYMYELEFNENDLEI